LGFPGWGNTKQAGNKKVKGLMGRKGGSEREHEKDSCETANRKSLKGERYFKKGGAEGWFKPINRANVTSELRKKRSFNKIHPFVGKTRVRGKRRDRGESNMHDTKEKSFLDGGDKGFVKKNALRH